MKNKNPKYISLKNKIVIVSSVFTVAIIIIFGTANFIEIRKILRDSIYTQNIMIADLLSDSMSRIVDEEIEDILVYISDDSRNESIEDSNLRYEHMPSDELNAYMTSMDEKWYSSPEDSALIKEYTKNTIAKELVDISINNPDIVEIFITDRYGGTVAASHKISDFYQADEKWWQKTSAFEVGGVFLGDIIYDESAGMRGLILATPIYNESEKFIGVCKLVLDADRVLAPIKDFANGRKRLVMVVDNSGIVVYNQNPALNGKLLLGDIVRQDISDSISGYFISKKPNLQNTDSFVAYSNVDNPFLIENEIIWKIFASYDVAEAFRPLRELFLIELLLITIMVLIFLPVIFFLVSRFIEPLQIIFAGIDEISNGSLDYRIKKLANDEFGMLAEMINNMSINIKKRTTSISHLNKEIAAHKCTELDLKESQLRYKSIYSVSKDAIMILSSSGKFISGNEATTKLFNCSDEKEFLSYGPSDLSPEYQPDGSPSSVKANEMMAKAMERGSHFFEWTHRKVGGEDFFADVMLVKMLLKGDHVLHATVHDVTDRKLAERVLKENRALLREQARRLEKANEGVKLLYKELEEKNKRLEKLDELKTQFLSTVSHELRTPLTITKEGINLILDKIPGDINKKQEEVLIMAKNNIDRLARIINDLLDISKIEAGKTELKKEVVDLAHIIKGVVSLFKPAALKEGIDIRANIPKEAAVILADADKITQVFTNLVGNALKFTKKGFVTISVKSKVDAIECCVSDTGVGVSEEGLLSMFDKFQQLGSNSISKERGTGLGLSIAKSIIELHGGSVWAESKLGEGTKVIFVLPRPKTQGKGRGKGK